MGTSTSIEWTNATWNPIRGCSRVSEGCRNCYAERQAVRGIHGAYEGLIKTVAVTKDGGGKLPVVLSEPRWTGEVRFIEEHLEDPLRWRKPKRIFVNSMSDLFHEKVTVEQLCRICEVMGKAKQHIFQVLTKRPEKMKFFLEELSAFGGKPPGHIWWGVSVEDQKTADERIPLLLKTPTAVRWVSYEPALAPVNFERIIERYPDCIEIPIHSLKCIVPPHLDWVVVGGESGPGARPFNIEWVRDVIAQCKAGRVPCFVKQLGANVKSRNDAGFEGDTPTCWPMDTHYEELDTGYQGAPIRILLKDRKGGDWNEWPEDLRVRDYPR